MLVVHCFSCGASGAEFTCSRCQSVRFCNSDCQRKGWRHHKPDCRPQSNAVIDPSLRTVLVHPNVGALQGEVELNWTLDLNELRTSAARNVFGSAGPCQIRFFTQDGMELTEISENSQNLYNGATVSDGALPRRRDQDLTSDIGTAAAAAVPRYDPRLVGGQVLRITSDDPELASLLRCSVPILIEGSGFLGNAAQDWSLEYLERHLNDIDSLNVLHAPALSCGRFGYYDRRDEKNPCSHRIEETNESLDMRFCDFRLRATQARKQQLAGKPCSSYYLQNTVLHRSEGETGEAKPVGSFGTKCGIQVMKDIDGFRWEWLSERMDNKKPMMCQFFCGMDGGFSPCHYDPQDNIFAQVRGFKRVLLFHPKYFGCLYPWPVHHPQDRQSRVDFDSPDLEAFPRYTELLGQGLEAILGPGDLLHIPPGWWHHIEMLPSPASSEVVSVNVWYDAPSWFDGDVQEGAVSWDKPLFGTKLMFFRRFLEEIAGKLSSPKDVFEVLSTCAKGIRHFPPPGSPLFHATSTVSDFVKMMLPDVSERTQFFVELIAGRYEQLDFGV